MRYFRDLIIVCLSLFLLSGCYDKTEMEQQGYVAALGLDKTEGEEGLFDITYQISNPEVGTQATGGGTQEKPKYTYTLSATDFLSAQNTANSFISREITLDFTKILVVSEELARSDEFMNIMETASRTKTLKSNVNIIVSKERAQEFLGNIKSELETRPHKYFQFIINRATEIGIIPKADIHNFFQITEGDADLYLAMYATSQREGKLRKNEDGYIAGEVPQKGKKEIQFIGSAVFKEGKLIDVITGDETRICNVLDNTKQMTDVLAVYPDPIKNKYKITLKFVKNKKTKVDIHYQKEKTTEINVLVPVEIEILSVPSLVDYSSNDKNKELLIKNLENDLETKYKKFIAKTQEEYKTDPFYWSIYIRKYFTTISAYEEANWSQKIYPNANIDVDVKLEKIRFGKNLKATNLSQVRD